MVPLAPVIEKIEVPVTVATTYNPKKLDQHTLTHCVAYLRTKGINIRGVDAKWFDTFNGTTPQVGGIALLNYDGVWHVAYIEKILGDGLWISETNYKAGQYTERLLDWNDSHIEKFIVLPREG